MSEVKHGRGYVYSIQYHVVFCTKYRKPVLAGDVASEIERVLREVAREGGFEVAELAVQPDHVHLLLDCSPQHFIPDMAKRMKGVSARRLFKALPRLRGELWGGHLWNPSYFVATVSESTEAQVRAYIEGQEAR